METGIRIRLLREGAKIPEYATGGSAAFDLRACMDKEELTINPGELKSVPTGIAIQPEDAGFATFVFARSGLAVKHGVALSNGVGVIDADYTGEISVGLVNLSDKPYTIKNGERIAQAAVMPVSRAVFALCSKLDATARGAGGFGSSGRM